MLDTEAIVTVDPAVKLASVTAPHDPYCPWCSPDEETAAELCDDHFEERWAA